MLYGCTCVFPENLLRQKQILLVLFSLHDDLTKKRKKGLPGFDTVMLDL